MQEPQAGGVFEYVENVRSKSDPGYDKVKAVLHSATDEERARNGVKIIPQVSISPVADIRIDYFHMVFQTPRLVSVFSTIIPLTIQSPGDLLLFRGHESMHRVTPTVGDTPRMLSVLSYDLVPNKMLNEYTRMKFYGR
jgi:hypothetical protein